MSDLEIIIECCKHLGLTKEEATTVLRIVHSPEERSDMVEWMRENIKASPEPIYVIIAAGKIQMRHRNKSKSPRFDSISFIFIMHLQILILLDTISMSHHGDKQQNLS
jgi:hypothetical protein